MEEKEAEDLDGKSERSEILKDPGACRHGNFVNYYRFHAAEERVRQLPDQAWPSPRHRSQKYLALDIGCNSGELTYMLYEFLENIRSKDWTEVSLIGVDLDPSLIQRARECNPWPDRVLFRCLDFLSPSAELALKDHLESLGRSRFDVVFCFSITMWIHLNHGDEGLEAFLRRACSLAEAIVIEPQEWRSYRNASRRLRRLKGEEFHWLKTLKYKGNMMQHVENILVNVCGFRKLVVTANNHWNRHLLLYSRTA